MNVANRLPEKIPIIKNKLIVLPDFPTSSLGTCSGPKEKAVEVIYPLDQANRAMFTQTNIPRALV